MLRVANIKNADESVIISDFNPKRIVLWIITRVPHGQDKLIMVDLKNEPAATPKKSKHQLLSMTTVKSWFMSEKKHHADTPFRQRMPESFLRSIRRRSLRVKRAKSLVLPEKRKSGERC